MARHKATANLLRQFHTKKKLTKKIIPLRPYQEDLMDIFNSGKEYVALCWARRLGR